jgi:hypothetical protein
VPLGYRNCKHSIVIFQPNRGSCAGKGHDNVIITAQLNFSLFCVGVELLIVRVFLQLVATEIKRPDAIGLQ